DFTGLVIDDFRDREGPFEALEFHADLFDSALQKLVVKALDDLLPFGNDNSFSLGIFNVVGRLRTDEITAQAAIERLAFEADRNRLIKCPQNLGIRSQA